MTGCGHDTLSRTRFISCPNKNIATSPQSSRIRRHEERSSRLWAFDTSKVTREEEMYGIGVTPLAESENEQVLSTGCCQSGGCGRSLSLL